MLKLPQEKSDDLIQKVKEISGENVDLCYQCGMCSSGCPAASEMDVLPRGILRLVQLGLQKDIEKSKTIWKCAACLTCTAQCPRGLDLTNIMEALRIIALRKNIDYVKPQDLSGEELTHLTQIALVSGFRKHTA